MKFPPSKFWNYSINTYQLPTIERVCLKLQQLYDADINILLYCCWVGEKHILLDEKDIEKLIYVGQPWQTNILVHIRNAHHTLNTSNVTLAEDVLEETRKSISEMEINAEHMAQLALEKAINLRNKPRNKHLDSRDCALHNLQHYFQQLKPSDDKEANRLIQEIIFALPSDNTTSTQPALTTGKLIRT
ncbi:MAG: TIGR02444 family protein [Gammaproteobacteria bacterium]|nr:TIGR02444 family protein [Gammaproteobacteria bacterium]